MKKLGLRYKAKKCKVMLMGTTGTEIKTEEEKLEKVDNFTYLGSTVSQDGTSSEARRRRRRIGKANAAFGKLKNNSQDKTECVQSVSFMWRVTKTYKRDRDKHLQDLYQAFLKLQYPPAEVKKQIDRARRVPKSHLLQDRPNKENNSTPLAVTFSPQLKPLQGIIRDLQPILKDDPLLSQILGDRPVLAYRQPPNLKQILTSNHTSLNKNTDPGTYPCNKARCQLCPHIYSSDIIIGPNHISHTIRGSFICTSTNVIYAIMCQQCSSAMYIGQTGQSLRKRINGHKSDIRNHNTQKPVGEHFNLSGHSVTDLRVAILQQKNFKNRLQRETPELELICKLDTINSGLNKDWEWLSHYKH
ncbi:uncharacterized protein LOC128838514 [Malaclemys terrapin pileata]|uniref:uncharacterized protein LOC128838514 n=1 Tax=Malaclemys terrapin pileata TaxID=2991368 RepID=UPI0023A86BD6|nr:uncharacterized protein LOC128838514 [Malaclemys terrapin pileata]